MSLLLNFSRKKKPFQRLPGQKNWGKSANILAQYNLVILLYMLALDLIENSLSPSSSLIKRNFSLDWRCCYLHASLSYCYLCLEMMSPNFHWNSLWAWSSKEISNSSWWIRYRWWAWQAGESFSGTWSASASHLSRLALLAMLGSYRFALSSQASR